MQTFSANPVRSLRSLSPFFPSPFPANQIEKKQAKNQNEELKLLEWAAAFLTGDGSRQYDEQDDSEGAGRRTTTTRGRGRTTEARGGLRSRAKIKSFN
ncbi:hypothetical protein L484_012506 [Morus notabilis]|uniref:Uncharacterized protein n=1 Tax=Morus notabilis TaxID=981085 RepID=W9QMF1_9ROSA|nr:hypothetical protein L484_012506 [Morus notabilis]